MYGQNQLPKPRKILFNYVESHVKSTGTVIVNSGNSLKQVEKELKQKSSVLINNTLSAKSCPLLTCSPRLRLCITMTETLKTQQIAQKVSYYYINGNIYNVNVGI